MLIWLYEKYMKQVLNRYAPETWDLSVHLQDPCPTPTSNDIGWPRLETCSILFTWGSLPSRNLLVTKARTVGKRGLRILRECHCIHLTIIFCVEIGFHLNQLTGCDKILGTPNHYRDFKKIIYLAKWSF